MSNKPTLLTETEGISGSIQQIIKEASEYVIIVSPYLQLNWGQMEKTMDILKLKKEHNRQLQVSIYVREDDKFESPTVKNLNEINDYISFFDIHLIKYLHAKIYMNEKRTIIASMNLYSSSVINNFEIGMMIKDKSMHDQIWTYVQNLSYSGKKITQRIPATKEKELFKFVGDKFNTLYKVLHCRDGDRIWSNFISQIVAEKFNLQKGVIYSANVDKIHYDNRNDKIVEYIDLLELQEIKGNCIACGCTIPFNHTQLTCTTHNNTKNYAHCFVCGKNMGNNVKKVAFCQGCAKVQKVKSLLTLSKQ